MTIQIITGNIWNSKAQTIVNTVNCEGVMGAGIALECRLRFPEMFSKYKEICEKGLLEPGLLLLHKNDQRWILNFPTKTLWKLPSKEEYLHTGLIKFKNTYKEKGITSVAFPLLGASHGGLTPEKSIEIMKNHLDGIDLAIEIYKYDPKANDDLYDEIKQFLLNHEGEIDILSKETKIQKQYLETLLEGMKFNPSICQVNQLIKLKGVGPATLEKLFAYKQNIKQKKYQTGFDF